MPLTEIVSYANPRIPSNLFKKAMSVVHGSWDDGLTCQRQKRGLAPLWPQQSPGYGPLSLR